MQYLEHTKKLFIIYLKYQFNWPPWISICSIWQCCSWSHFKKPHSLLNIHYLSSSRGQNNWINQKAVIKWKLELSNSEGNTPRKDTWIDFMLVKLAVYTLQLPLQTSPRPHSCCIVPDKTRAAGNPSALLSQLVLNGIYRSQQSFPHSWEPPSCTTAPCDSCRKVTCTNSGSSIKHRRQRSQDGQSNTCHWKNRSCLASFLLQKWFLYIVITAK